MNKRSGPVMRLASPFRAWLNRFTFVLLVAGSFGLMMLGKTDAFLIERSRALVADAVAPVLNAMRQPVAAAERVYENVEDLVQLRAENAALRMERERLLEWQAAASRLAAENQVLRDLLNVAPDPRVGFVSARVIGDHVGPFVREVLVAAGARDGLVKGQAAMTGLGLAGRVTEVGEHSARVLLLTDINSRIPVMLEGARDRAILAGDNSNRPQLLYLKTDAAPQPGDRVVTSGDGGIFPPGLAIGTVDSIAEGVVTVRPFVDWDHLDFMQIVDYALPGVLPDAPGQSTAGESEGAAASAATGDATP